MQKTENYKQTEVGLIPEEWEVKFIKQVAPLQRGFDLPTKDIKTGPFPVVYSNGIVNYHNDFKVKKPGVVTGRSGTIGKITFVEKDYWPHNTSLWVTNFFDNDPKFVFYLFNNLRIERFASGSGVPTLNRNDVHDFKIPLPPLPEQTAIASALSDMDALIAQTEKLIEKKKAIKQGVMQDLLKPKEGWVKRKLGEVADVVGGGTPSTHEPTYWNGDVNWFTPTEVGYSKYLIESNRKITKKGLESCSAKIHPVGTVLLTSRAGIGDLGILKFEAATNQGFQSLIAKKELDNEFLYYLMTTKKNELIQNSSGSTFLEISPQKVKAIDLSIPSIKEQKEIALTLSEIDDMIFTHESKLQKLKLQKQGMMQALLTGKIRLV